MAKIAPIAVLEVLPGDSFRHQTTCLLRVTPLVAPVMHPVTVQIHHWFVPNRILWAGWEDFITDPDSAKTIPTIQLDLSSVARTLELAEMMGIGHNIIEATSGAVQVINALPFRAYNKIINEFYLDQDIDTPKTETTGDTDTDASYETEDGRWEKDYFTTARTASQHGTEEGATITAGALPINEFRRAMATQKIREHRNRFGGRYRDYLAFLGINPSDTRLDRPEYLGGGRQTISFSEVLATSASGSGLGDLGGHGIAALSTRPYTRFFEEHGYVISLIVARPKLMYTQLIPKHYTRSVWSDYWQKELEMMGDQTILNEEIYYQHATPTNTFGYIPRHDDYRRHQSSVAGDFRTTLDEWHYARIFSADPALNTSFLECNPTDRVYVATSPDELMCQIRHRISARRILRKSGAK